jgi:hypothetical protein
VLTSLRSSVVYVFLGYFFVCAGACGGDDASSGKDPCVTLPAACTPGVDPTYTQIYGQILGKHCGGTNSGNLCHGPDGKKGGLGLFDPASAYDDLLGITGHARVQAGNPECSILMARLVSDDPTYRMPFQGTKLDEGLICAVQQWIKNGAAK